MERSYKTRACTREKYGRSGRHVLMAAARFSIVLYRDVPLLYYLVHNVVLLARVRHDPEKP
jgi:hypothetical protein